MPDQWYELNNPEETSTPMTIRFTTRRDDFPPNLERLRIVHVVLYVSRADGASFEVPVTGLRFTEDGAPGSVGGAATSVDGVISTRRGNAGSWMPIIGKTPFGTWELAFPDILEMRGRFTSGEIQDILLVTTYSAQTAAWPT
jgi:hypothetical protein